MNEYKTTVVPVPGYSSWLINLCLRMLLTLTKRIKYQIKWMDDKNWIKTNSPEIACLDRTIQANSIIYGRVCLIKSQSLGVIFYKPYNDCRCVRVIVSGAFKILYFSTSVESIYLNGPGGWSRDMHWHSKILPSGKCQYFTVLYTSKTLKCLY